MSPSEFAAKWAEATTSERAAAQEHFIDLCRMLGVQTPTEADPHGEWYAFEKGTLKLEGGNGFADVWKRRHFAWEYKGKHKSLVHAYRQLAQYREALENPPLLVVCDLNRFEIHTNFTGTSKVVHTFSLADLSVSPSEPLRILRAVMQSPEDLRPNITRQEVTEFAAKQFAELSIRLRQRGHEAHDVALFLNRLLFCLFAEDVRLLPERIVSRIIESTRKEPARFQALLAELFAKMAKRGGGYFGTDEIQWFNGGLFADGEVLPLTSQELSLLLRAAELDWANIEPAILGTLFERGLDPAKRSQLGAHYTDIAAIMRVIEPVILRPLRREFAEMKASVEELLSKGKKRTSKAKGSPRRVFEGFLDRLRQVRVLDPACGSGNFLYVTLRALKDLEKEVIVWGAQRLATTQELPRVGPENVLGIELNLFAAELARVTVWIGEIQWMIANGYSYSQDPVLRPLRTVECRDALLSDGATQPKRASWPDAEFIVGNPPFLGGKKLRTELGDEYVDQLFKAWSGHVPAEADLVAYWHERTREQIERGKTRRAGLLATQGIRGGANQRVLERIKQSGDIFAAWSDEPWVVEGAAVRVSIVAQDDGSEVERELDGQAVAVIHADLKGGAAGSADLTRARRLSENAKTAFMGDTKGGAFDIPREVAAELLKQPKNPNGRPNSDVVVPWVNGRDLTQRPRGMFIVDFGVDTDELSAAQYEAPFELIRRTVKPARVNNNRSAYAERWWLHVEPRPAMRKRLAPLRRFIATTRVAKHRLFVWLEPPTLPDSATIAIAHDDDFTFGVLHSRIHEAWSLGMCTWLGVGNDPRYTPTTTFETFPFPWPLNTPESELTAPQRRHAAAIGAAAENLHRLRASWLNPPDLVKRGKPLTPVFPPPLLPVNEAAAKELKKRTLTNLYNARPQWLSDAHERLDAAVLDSYGWPRDIPEAELLERLLELNLKRGSETE